MIVVESMVCFLLQNIFFSKNNDLEIKKTKSPPKFKISPGPLKKKILYKNMRFHALRLSPYIQRIKTKGLDLLR